MLQKIIQLVYKFPLQDSFYFAFHFISFGESNAKRQLLKFIYKR